MNISYEKLWAILQERGISRTELVHAAKLGKNEDVRVQILIKICDVLSCKIDDIMDYSIEAKK